MSDYLIMSSLGLVAVPRPLPGELGRSVVRGGGGWPGSLATRPASAADVELLPQDVGVAGVWTIFFDKTSGAVEAWGIAPRGPSAFVA